MLSNLPVEKTYKKLRIGGSHLFVALFCFIDRLFKGKPHYTIEFQSNSPQAVATGNDAPLTQATSAVPQKIADQYQLYQQLPDGHVQVYKLPAGIVPILVPANSEDVQPESNNLHQLQIPVHAQVGVGSVISNNTTAIPSMNCASLNKTTNDDEMECKSGPSQLSSVVPPGLVGDGQNRGIVFHANDESIQNLAADGVSCTNEYQVGPSESSVSSTQVLPQASISGQILPTNSSSLDIKVKMENLPVNTNSQTLCNLQETCSEQAHTLHEAIVPCSSSYNGQSIDVDLAESIKGQSHILDQTSNRLTTENSNQVELPRQNVDHLFTQSQIDRNHQQLQTCHIPDINSKNVTLPAMNHPSPLLVNPMASHSVNTMQTSSHSLTITNQNIDPKNISIGGAGIDEIYQHQKQLINNTQEETMNTMNPSQCLPSLTKDKQGITLHNQYSARNPDVSSHVVSSGSDCRNSVERKCKIRNESGRKSTVVASPEQYNVLFDSSLNPVDLNISPTTVVSETQSMVANCAPGNVVATESKQSVSLNAEMLSHQQLCETCGSISLLNESSGQNSIEDNIRGGYSAHPSPLLYQDDKLPKSLPTQQRFEVATAASNTMPNTFQDIGTPSLIAPQNTPVHPVKGYRTSIPLEALSDQPISTTIMPINRLEKGILETTENKAEQRQEGNMALVDPHKVSPCVVIAMSSIVTYLKNGDDETHPLPVNCS